MKKILCVEAGSFTANLLRMKAEGRGFSFIWERDAENGFKAAVNHAPDVIISEIMLPAEEDGFRFCQRLKGERRTAGTPLVILTRKKKDPKANFMFNQWASEYFEKPFNTRVLFGRIEELLKKRK